MANKGKNTNSSQFFITYRPAKHLDRKHTIFGKVVGGLDTLSRLENVEVSEDDKRPLEAVEIKDIAIFVDPFEEFLKRKREKDDAEKGKEEVIRNGGTEDDKTTWTGKRIQGNRKVDVGGEEEGVGRYLKQRASGFRPDGMEDEVVGEWGQDVADEPVNKKAKVRGGFGNFDTW